MQCDRESKHRRRSSKLLQIQYICQFKYLKGSKQIHTRSWKKGPSNTQAKKPMYTKGNKTALQGEKTPSNTVLKGHLG